MARTTILIQDDLLLEVKRVAQTKGVTMTEVIKNALKAYVDSQPRSGLPSFTAVGRSQVSGKGRLARDAKKAASKAIDPYEGSSRETKR